MNSTLTSNQFRIGFKLLFIRASIQSLVSSERYNINSIKEFDRESKMQIYKSRHRSATNLSNQGGDQVQGIVAVQNQLSKHNRREVLFRHSSGTML